MSDAAIQARNDLYAALAGVPDLVPYKDLGATIDPPGLVVGPPRLAWTMLTTQPTEATFAVFVIGALGEDAIEDLYAYVQPVADAITDNYPEGRATVQSADPTVYPSGGSDLPALEFSVDVALL